MLAVDCHELKYGVLGDAVPWYHPRDCVYEIVGGLNKCICRSDGGHCEILVFEENCVADSCVPCVGDVYLVALVMFLRVSKVVSAGGMWCPCLSDAGMKVRFNLAAQRGIWVCIVIVLAPEICVGGDSQCHS